MLIKSIRQSGAVLGLVAIAGVALPTNAQAAVGNDRAKTGAKGAFGGALVGAELAVGVEAAMGVHKWWAYALGGGLGAAAGGVGGYFIGKANTAAATGLTMGGLLLAVPTTVFMMSALSYKPPTQAAPENDTAFLRAPAGTPLLSSAQFDALMLQVPSAPAFANFTADGFQMRMPSVAIGDVYSELDRQTLGAPRATEYTAAALRLTF